MGNNNVGRIIDENENKAIFFPLRIGAERNYRKVEGKYATYIKNIGI